ncbi:endogenous retrovirus group K member 18 Pol protein-like protein [Turdus rufiventris]|nr:endogenous retrovirus group K member 18 Pol protein-like protein [Turdus rufiventris]
MGMPKGGVLRVEESVQLDSAEFDPALEGPLPPTGGEDPQGTEGAQAFPVFNTVPNTGQFDRHDPIAWRVVQDLQDKVARFGLGSTQGMPIIRVLNTGLLAPYDVRHIDKVLFQPVQFMVFEDNWRQMAEKAAAENMVCSQEDPRADQRDLKDGGFGSTGPPQDDILVAAPTQDELLRIEPRLLAALRCYGLQVTPDKVQQQPPWRYLRIKILDQKTQHQEVQFTDSIKTLNDAQKLLGVIGWLRPYLELSTEQLSPLFNILKGDTRLDSPRTLTPKAQQALQRVQRALSTRQVYRVDPSIDTTVFIVNPDSSPTGIIGQWNDAWSDPSHILKWVFLPHQLRKTATTVF